MVTRYNLPVLSDASWITQDELNIEVNASLQAFYALLMDCQGDDYFATYADVTTVASADTSDLPDGFVRALNVTWLRDTDDPVQLEQAQARDARMSGLVAQSWDCYTPKWALHGVNALRWFPTPNAVYTVRLTFVKLPADLDELLESGDTFDAGPGWEEWVVNDVCAKLADREERDPGRFVQERERMEARIRDQAPQRGDTSGGLLLDASPTGRMGSWELRNWLTRGGC